MRDKIFDKLMKNEQYNKLLDQLPEDERLLVIKSLKEITERFEREVYTPLKNHLGK